MLYVNIFLLTHTQKNSSLLDLTDWQIETEGQPT